jgi:ribosomal protein S20
MKLFLKIPAVGAAIMVSLAGCATSVPINSVRPPTIDTSDIQRLAIKPFENKSGVRGHDGAQITRYLTETAERLIKNTGKFTIVAPTDPNADGVFIGEMRSFTSKESLERIEKKDKNGNPYFEVMYNRDVYLEFSYSVISSRTDMPAGTVIKQGSNGSSGLAANVTDTLTLAKSIVDSQMGSLARDIVPTIISTNRQLVNETSKDKELKHRMKEALALVKNGNYEEAIGQYDEINREYDSAAARTNAGILRESIASDDASRAELKRLFNDTNGLTDKAVKNAIDRLNSKLPKGANIMIMKTNSTERNMLDYVVNQMTKTIVQAGRLKVVDRSNQMLINAEQQFQLSGNADDDSMVSIGQQLGVHYIVICWISGEKSLRRLNQKVLNIKTTQITDQSDFEI